MEKVQVSRKKEEETPQTKKSSETQKLQNFTKKFGHEMPRKNDYDHDVRIDKKNGNHLRDNYIKLEIDQQH